MRVNSGDDGVDDVLGIVRGSAAYRRLSVALLLAGFATFAILYATQPLLPLFTATFHLSAEAASLAVSLATGPMAVALLGAGILSDRVGRRPMMIASLLSAACLTVLAGLVPDWHWLLALRVLTGIALSGIPAVAMAYIAEEVDGPSIAPAMGLYIAGSASGGMIGRLGVGVLADLFGWRAALSGVGVAALAGALLFAWLVPASAAFTAQRHDLRSYAAALGRIGRDPALPWLYAAAFLLMGTLITIYNYIGFRLLAPPYGLNAAAVGAIFLLYILGSFSSAWFGGLAGRQGMRRIFPIPVVALFGGIALTAASPLPVVIAGMGVVTIGFFGAHSIASSWVGRRSRGDRAQAASFYLFFYYLGSSIVGSAGGIAWSRAGWGGIVLFAGTLTCLTLVAAARLARVQPLAENQPSARVSTTAASGSTP